MNSMEAQAEDKQTSKVHTITTNIACMQMFLHASLQKLAMIKLMFGKIPKFYLYF